jgi:hypothetical protein
MQTGSNNYFLTISKSQVTKLYQNLTEIRNQLTEFVSIERNISHEKNIAEYNYHEFYEDNFASCNKIND